MLEIRFATSNTNFLNTFSANSTTSLVSGSMMLVRARYNGAQFIITKQSKHGP